MSNPFDDIPFDDGPAGSSEPHSNMTPSGQGSGIAARAMAARSVPNYLDGLNPEQRRAVETVHNLFQPRANMRIDLKTCIYTTSYYYKEIL